MGIVSLGATGFIVSRYGDPTNGESATGPVTYLPTPVVELQPIPNVSADSDADQPDLQSLLSETTTDERLGVAVELTRYSHPISPYIYGINFSDPATLTSMNIPLRRWGGNATTRYNWKTDVSNRGSDWFFENIPNEDTDLANLPESSSANRFFAETLKLGIDPVITVPLIGWTPKGDKVSCGFPASVYGQQQYMDPYQNECGNGISPEGALLVVNDPGLISDPIGPRHVTEWVEFLNQQFGTSAEGGIRFYNLDNEPMIWHETHRDVHPDPVGYAEMKERTLEYASAIKEADPNAKTLGPVAWGWSTYFYSARDLKDNSAMFDNPDRDEYDDRPFVPWYLEQMRIHEEETGVRILDYLDLHYYSDVPNLSLSNEINADLKKKRFNATRSLWDPTYRDESWINQPIQLIPRMHDWIEQEYPGTGTAITEYNFGAVNHITGALVQADALGIFGRERLDLATMWDPPTADQPAAFAFKMYRNYDGNNSTFGDLSLPAGTSDQNRVSVYAAHRQSDGVVTIILINKSDIVEPITLDLVGRELNGEAYTHYRYAEDALNEIVEVKAATLSENGLELNLNAESINLIVIGE